MFCEDHKAPPDMSRGAPGRLIYHPSLLTTSPDASAGSTPLHHLLMQHDQLTQLLQQQSGSVFAGFREAPISFPPTFKYDKRSSRFDSSAKQRIPAYTDRILFASKTQQHKDGQEATSEGKEGLEVHVRDYYSVDVRHSDHRPVCGKYTIQI